jgi:PAS domain S-box-containing protein
MDDGVLVLDGDDRVVDANPAASRMFGVTDAKSMVGRPITEIDIPDAELLGRSEDDQTTNVIAVNGTSETQQYVNVRRSSLSDAGSSEPGTVLLLRDVTELKRQAARLERKNERLERVGQTIAHDLWNPLNVAQGRLELAAETGDHEHLDEVENAHDRMGEIIEEILDMARNEQVAGRKRVGLPNVAEAAWANVETGGVDLEFDDCGVSVLADESELTSAFENLFRNAVEHGSTDSRPSANDTVEHSESELTIRVGGLDGEPGFYVEDDGRGIPEHERQEVFEAGYTTHEDGSGVGLTVVGDVAERHGWTVEVTESDAGGARFEFRGVETERAPTPTQ